MEQSFQVCNDLFTVWYPSVYSFMDAPAHYVEKNTHMHAQMGGPYAPVLIMRPVVALFLDFFYFITFVDEPFSEVYHRVEDYAEGCYALLSLWQALSCL